MQDLNLTWTYSTGNLQKRTDNSHATSLEESFTYDNLNRLTGSTVTGLTGQLISYSPNGNIASKTDAGAYSYLASKPNAVSAVSNTSSTIPVLQQLISYTAFMQPQVLTENNYELTYTYGADYERIKGVLKQNTTLMRTRYYVGTGYEKDISASSTKEVHYISSPAGLIAIVVKETNAYTYHYVHSDHLGSILTITTSSGVVEFEQNFDAWGRRRNTTTWAYTGVTAPPDWLYRGYTGHEHLAEFNLINLNGRLYDPVVGRVLSPDNFVQDPFSTQGFNRYSYGFNNPLKYSDPDGNNPLIGALIGALGYTLSVAFSEGGFNNWNWLQFFGSVAIGALTGGIGQEIAAATASLGSVGSGAISGIVSGAIAGGYSSAFAGGDFGRGAWQGGLLGGALGALGGTFDELTKGPNQNKLYSGDLLADGGPDPVAYTKTLPAVTVRAPWWQRLTGFLSESAGTFVARASIIASIPFIVEGDVSPTQYRPLYYTPPPKELLGFPDARRVPNRGRARWKTPEGDILEWDSQHGEVEVYDKQGRHTHVADPNTGNKIKPKVPGRKTSK